MEASAPRGGHRPDHAAGEGRLEKHLGSMGSLFIQVRSAFECLGEAALQLGSWAPRTRVLRAWKAMGPAEALRER